MGTGINVDMGFYETYIRSPEWQAKRRFMLQWANHRCQQCGYSENPEVHHLTYDRLGKERIPEDLEVLCSPCHALLHGRAPRVMPVTKGLSRLEKQQIHALKIALGEALGNAVAAGDDALAHEIRKVMTENGKRKLPWSRRRRRKEIQRTRSRNQRAEPPASWETAVYDE